MTISIQEWSGVEGYQLLAGVWSDTGLAGGAFWTVIETDPFTSADVVHPTYDGPEAPDDPRDWGAGDYVWGEAARLDAGTYTIDFWAHPGGLAPYGSHIPASPIERWCSVEVEVDAGETTSVVIGGIPETGDECLSTD